MMSKLPASIEPRQLWWVGPLTVLADIIGVLIVRILAVMILKPNPQPMSLGWSAPIVFTLVLCTGAVFVFALTARFANNPIRAFITISIVFLIISFLPDIAFATSPLPGANWANAIALMAMHVVAGFITVNMLIKLTATEIR
jgi:FtsH-binding integral membrane protein